MHRFTSPDWLAPLKNHLAAASTLAVGVQDGQTQKQTGIVGRFGEIVELDAGESLVCSVGCAPSCGWED